MMNSEGRKAKDEGQGTAARANRGSDLHCGKHK